MPAHVMGDHGGIAPTIGDTMSEVLKKAKQVLWRIAERIREEAYDESPKRSTDLARSIIVTDEGPLAVAVGPSVDYGLYVHEGTGEHGPKKRPIVIKAKKKKALHFKMNGEGVFAKSVVNPGQKPNPFMDRAVDNLDDWIVEYAAEEMADAVLIDLRKIDRL